MATDAEATEGVFWANKLKDWNNPQRQWRVCWFGALGPWLRCERGVLVLLVWRPAGGSETLLTSCHGFWTGMVFCHGRMELQLQLRDDERNYYCRCWSDCPSIH